MNNVRPENITLSIKEGIAMNELKNIIKVKSIAVSNNVSDYISLEDEVDEDTKIEQASCLKSIISLLNEIYQVVSNALGRDAESSGVEDIDEAGFIKQLINYNKQNYDLLNNFDRSLLPAYFEQTSYLANLAEIHYDTTFGSIKESCDDINIEEDNKSKEIGNIVKQLPEIKTNDLA